MNINTIVKTAQEFVKTNSTVILSGTAVAGVVATAIFAGRGHHRAAQKLDYYKDTDMNFRDKFEMVWKDYAPAFILGTATVGTIVAANRISARKRAALISALGMATETARKFESKVISDLGEDRVRAYKDQVDADNVKNTPQTTENTYIVSDSEALFFDSWSGRYFTSSMEHIRRIVNDLAHRLVTGTDRFIMLNEFYSELGLPGIEAGDDVGWDDEYPIDVEFSSQLTTDGKPAAVVRFTTKPLGWDSTHLGN